MNRRDLALAFACFTPLAPAQQLPSVPGYSVEVYADVSNPARLAFEPSGVLYAGRNETGVGTNAPWKIHRIGLGGAPVTEYGDSGTIDPDAVIFDAHGVVSAPGSVLVGGQVSSGSGGQISQIAPDETVTALFGPTQTIYNPSGFAFDGGRLLVTNGTTLGSSPGIYQVVGGVLSLLVATPVPVGTIHLDSAGRIFVGGSDGTLRIYASDGTLLDPAFLTGLTPGNVFTIGSFGGFPESVYAVDNVFHLLRVDLQGASQVIGTGMPDVDLAFGPDGALYAADQIRDRVLRIAEGPVAYCTAGNSASGCQALLQWTGTASASAPSGFTLSASGVEGSKDGIFFYGTNGRQANLWGNGSSFQCVVPPVTRTSALSGVGTNGACDGAFALDLNALWCPSCPKPWKNPGAGAALQLQLWYRDPQSTSNQTTSLSNALELAVEP